MDKCLNQQNKDKKINSTKPNCGIDKKVELDSMNPKNYPNGQGGCALAIGIQCHWHTAKT